MRHSVLNTVAKFLNRQKIVKVFGKPFPKVLHNATEFGFKQILMAITLSSISGISRICKMAAFSSDSLLKPLLKLDRAINENAISAPLKTWGQRSLPKLQMLLLSKNTQWLHESGLKSITLDADSTVKSVCGNQERASNAFNKTKKREKSCHSLLVFASKMNLLYHTRFRTESAYTANGIVDFTKEVEASPKKHSKNVFSG